MMEQGKGKGGGPRTPERELNSGSTKRSLWRGPGRPIVHSSVRRASGWRMWWKDAEALRLDRAPAVELRSTLLGRQGETESSPDSPRTGE